MAINLLLFDATDAAALYNATSELTTVIECREILAGPFVGQWATSPNVLADPHFTFLSETLTLGVIESIDVDAAWPPEE